MSIDAFLEHNPWSKLTEHDSGKRIELPWNDSTLILELSAIDDSAVDRLNGVILFPSFSAVYHRTEERMELIYTPFRQTDLATRSFSFEFEGCTYTCRYTPPSQVVLDLARASTPVKAPTATDYRNLRQFRRYIAISDSEKKEAGFEERYSPVSFWIEPCVADEQQLARLFEHLNFFMAYFDDKSPTILLHEAEPADALKEKRIRYLWDTFPDQIRATSIDPYLLGLWSSARAASDTFRQFIYYYQMLEYAGFYFLTEKSEKNIEAILKAPETAAFPNRAWQRIQDVLAGEKIEEGAKLVAVVKQSVDIDSIWKEVEANRKVFEATLNFDGGYSLPPVIAPSTDLASFRASGLEKLVNTFRLLRNALVHAREKRMANVISASRRNHALVRPYIKPLSSIAMQLAQASSG
jgi:hypothetical protein